METGKVNQMSEARIEKVVLNVGGVADVLEKGARLLERITGKKISRRASKKRIPSLGVRPGLEVGAMVTLRGKEAIDLLRRLLVAVDNKIKRKQLSEGTVSFGIKEYIEIPGMEYQRDVGIMGFDVTISFIKPGRRVTVRRIKKGKLPRRQRVSKQEIEKYLSEKLNVSFIGK